MKRYHVRITLRNYMDGEVWETRDVIKYTNQECNDAVIAIVNEFIVYIYNSTLKLEIEELY